MNSGFESWLRHTRKYLGAFYHTNKNKALGRSFVPDPRWRLFVEPVSFCNLACKFCSYPKKVRTRTLMETALFERCIDQAAEMGFAEVFLTPITGDVFMDKNFLSKLAYIEDSDLKTTAFYTNFIGVDPQMLRSILSFRKLRFMEISLYGHDEESFKNITGRAATQYRRLIENLHTLRRLLEEAPSKIEIVLSFRTYRSFDPDNPSQSDLTHAVDALARMGIAVGRSSQVDNWGGAITESDVEDIEMDLVDGARLYKKGPCTLPFDSIQITATGEVNACACRDPKGTLKIGHLAEAPLRQIISVENQAWQKIITDHEKGRFNETCAACGFYKSIYDPRRFDENESITKEEYFRRLENGA